MNNLQATELLEIARRMQAGLTQLGLCHQLKQAGLTVGVSFRSLELVDQGDGGAADFGLLEIDMLSLPRRVTAARLTKTEVLHHLRAIVGKPVYMLNASGITYCVDLRSSRLRAGAARLPERVNYHVTGRPEDTPPYALLGLGVSSQGPLWVHPEQLKNVLVVGAQGYGKSGLLRLLVYQALNAGWRLMLADPESTTFNPQLWHGVETLIGHNVASSRREVELLFNLALQEIERRVQLYSQAPGYPDNLDEYNAVASNPLPRWGLFVDEANTYLVDKTLAEQAAELARRARKWGLHCIFAGHNWRSNEIPRGTSGMFQTRIAFRVNDDTSGKVVLERAGAEQLPAIPGRAIIRLGGAYRLIQTYFLHKTLLIKAVERQRRVLRPPTWDDLASEQAQNTADTDTNLDNIRAIFEAADPDQKTRIIRWLAHERHKSQNQIQQLLFDYTGGTAYTTVKNALA